MYLCQSSLANDFFYYIFTVFDSLKSRQECINIVHHLNQTGLFCRNQFASPKSPQILALNKISTISIFNFISCLPFCVCVCVHCPSVSICYQNLNSSIKRKKNQQKNTEISKITHILNQHFMKEK